MGPTKTVIAIDPGGTTGIAWLMPDGTYKTAIALQPEEIWDCIKPDLIDLVVYEDYAGSYISKYGLHTVRVIGGIRALCHYHNIPIIRHVPQTRKSKEKPAREYLQANKGDTFVVHEVDALAHLMTWQVEQTQGVQLRDEAPKRKATGGRTPSKFNKRNLGKYA